LTHVTSPLSSFFCSRYHDHRYLHSFPTRRSSDLKSLFLFIFYFLNLSHSFAQIDVNDQKVNFERDIDLIVEELKFMYDTDQALREYTLFKTYNKAITDSIENLSQDKVREYIISNSFKSDS